MRLVELSKLPGPIAFGIFRLTIGLPPGFHRNFNIPQQDAMIAHELAHLAVHDPAWGVLADAVVAVFWWHPLVWWARRQLCAANEAAADEASLLIADGPMFWRNVWSNWAIVCRDLSHLAGWRLAEMVTGPRWAIVSTVPPFDRLLLAPTEPASIRCGKDNRPRRLTYRCCSLHRRNTPNGA